MPFTLKPPESKRIQFAEDAYVDLVPLRWDELEELRQNCRDKDGRLNQVSFVTQVLKKTIKAIAGFVDVNGKELSVVHLETLIPNLPEVLVAKLLWEAQSYGLVADDLLGKSKAPSPDLSASGETTDGVK